MKGRQSLCLVLDGTVRDPGVSTARPGFIKARRNGCWGGQLCACCTAAVPLVYG